MATKITNITDVRTPLRDKTTAQPKAFKVLNTMIAPGDHGMFNEADICNPAFPNELHPQINKLVAAGLAWVGELPPWYLSATRAHGYKGKPLSSAKLFSAADVVRAPKSRVVGTIKRASIGPKSAPKLDLSGKKRPELVQLATDMGIAFTTQTSNKDLSALILAQYNKNTQG